MKKEENKKLYGWLEYEWIISNHRKYQKYYIEWVTNLTNSQIEGFNKMRLSDYIQH